MFGKKPKKGEDDKDPSLPVGSAPEITELLRAVHKGKIRKVESALATLTSADSLNAPDVRSGMNSLHIAAALGFEAIIRRLVDAGIAVNKLSCGPGSFSGTALHFAAREGKDSVVLLLLGIGASYDIPDSLGRLPLQCAIDERRGGCFAVLLRRILKRESWQPQLRFLVTDNGTLLHEAARSRFPKALGPLVKGGLAGIDSQDSRGNTALHVATANGDPESIRALLGLGANKSIRNAESKTALDIAIWLQHIACCEALDPGFPKPPLVVQEKQVQEKPEATSTKPRLWIRVPKPSPESAPSTARTPPPIASSGRVHAQSAPPAPVPPAAAPYSAPATPAQGQFSDSALESFFEDLLRDMVEEKKK